MAGEHNCELARFQLARTITVFEMPPNIWVSPERSSSPQSVTGEFVDRLFKFNQL